MQGFKVDRVEEYRNFMIRRILELQDDEEYTKEELQRKATRELQRIFEEVEKGAAQ